MKSFMSAPLRIVQLFAVSLVSPHPFATVLCDEYCTLPQGHVNIIKKQGVAEEKGTFQPLHSR